MLVYKREYLDVTYAMCTRQAIGFGDSEQKGEPTPVRWKLVSQYPLLNMLSPDHQIVGRVLLGTL